MRVQVPECRATWASPDLARAVVAVFRDDEVRALARSLVRLLVGVVLPLTLLLRPSLRSRSLPQGEARTNAAGVLVDLSRDPAYQALLAEPSLGLLPALADVLTEDAALAALRGASAGAGPGQVSVNCLAVLWHLALLDSNRAAVAATPNMLPALCRALRGAHATARLNAAGTAMNLAVCPANKVCACVVRVRVCVLIALVAPFRPLSSPKSGQPAPVRYSSSPTPLSLPPLSPSLT